MQKLKAATYCPVSSDPEDQERRKVYNGKYMQNNKDWILVNIYAE